VSKVKEAVSCFTEGFNCSQSIFSTYAPELGLDREATLKMSCSFGAGMSMMGETCGAVNGALMVIGLKLGNISADDIESKERTYAVVRDFISRFIQCNGSIKCKDILGCDISTTEGLEMAKEKQLITTLCPKFVEDAALIIEQILNMNY
jgi:C_GCAxxG_C_C family probable redox protein